VVQYQQKKRKEGEQFYPQKLIGIWIYFSVPECPWSVSLSLWLGSVWVICLDEVTLFSLESAKANSSYPNICSVSAQMKSSEHWWLNHRLGKRCIL